MQDDIYLTMGEGWFRPAQPRRIVQDSKRNLKEAPDLILKQHLTRLRVTP